MATPRIRQRSGVPSSLEPLTTAGGPRIANGPLRDALTDLLHRTGISLEDVTRHLGRDWRFLLRGGVEQLSGRRLTMDDLAQLRRVFDLPPGYFVEEREAFVIERLRLEPELRDRLYFALVDRDGRRAAGPGHAAALVDGAPSIENADDEILVPLAPPAALQLVLVVLDTSMSTARMDSALPRDDIDRGLAMLLGDLFRSQDASSFSVAVITYNNGGVASTVPADPRQLRSPAFIDALWHSVEAAASDSDEPPLLDHALVVAHSIAEPFVLQDSDVPVSVNVLVLSSGMGTDRTTTLDAADRLKQLPALSVIAIDLIDRRLENGPCELLRELSSDPGTNPRSLDTPLAQHLRPGRVRDLDFD